MNQASTRVLIFVGAVAQGTIPTGGETAKNYNFLSYFKNIYDKVIICDTMWWKRNPIVFFKILSSLIFYPKATIFISASARSVDMLIRIIPNKRLREHVFYSTIGGVFHELVQDRRVNIEKHRNIRMIMVESDKMKEALCQNGLGNCIKIPNIKFIKYYPREGKSNDGIVHFLFLSRITPLKGCDLIFSSCQQLCKEGYDGKFDITFYGEIMEEYRENFEAQINAVPQCQYHGIIDLTQPEQYDILSNYDVMLFPTFWPGEGFPGVLVDAFIASLPIIASTWHHNAEIVTDKVNGYLIKPQDIDDLVEKMRYMIDNPHEIERLRVGSRKEAEKYDIQKVYSVDFMHKIGML